MKTTTDIIKELQFMTDAEKITHFLNISEDISVPVIIRAMSKNKALSLMNKIKPNKRGQTL